MKRSKEVSEVKTVKTTEMIKETKKLQRPLEPEIEVTIKIKFKK